MDGSILTVGIVLFLLGFIGLHITYSEETWGFVISENFKDGLNALAGLSMVLGIILIPGGLLKGGIPIPGPRATLILTVFSVVLVSGLITASIAGIPVFPLLSKPEAAERAIFSVPPAEAAKWISINILNETQTLTIEELKERLKGVPRVTVVTILEGSYLNQGPEVEYFSPKVIRVVIGVNNTVVWFNGESTPIFHTSTNVARQWDSKLFGPEDVFVAVFNEPGEYDYFCIPHPWMRGKVIVEEAA